MNLLIVACHSDTKLRINATRNNLQYFKEYANYIVMVNSLDLEVEQWKLEETYLLNDKCVKESDDMWLDYAKRYKETRGIKNVVDIRRYYFTQGIKSERFVQTKGETIFRFEYIQNDRWFGYSKVEHMYMTCYLEKLECIFNNIIVTNDSYILTRHIPEFLDLFDRDVEMSTFIISGERVRHATDFLVRYTPIGFEKWIDLFRSKKYSLKTFQDLIDEIEIKFINEYKSVNSAYDSSYCKHNIHFHDESRIKWLTKYNYPILKLKKMTKTYYEDLDIPDDFSPEEYKEMNQDLKNFSKEQLIYHFKQHGLREGRLYKKNQILNYQPYVTDAMEIKHIAMLIHNGKHTILEIIYKKYENFFKNPYLHLFISVHSEECKKDTLKLFPNAIVTIVPNKGMDVGGQLNNVRNVLKHPLYDKFRYFYFIHTKTDANWREQMLTPILNMQILPFLNENKPIIAGSDKYRFSNTIQHNRMFMDEILKRCGKFDEFKKKIEMYRTEFIHDISSDFCSDNGFNTNNDFYVNYHHDLNGMSDDNAKNHWHMVNDKELCRINNPCCIKKFGKENYFIAGTVFVCNKLFFDFFKNVDLAYEASILEDGYILNTIARKTHSWEYLYSLICTCMGGEVIGITVDFKRKDVEPLSIFDADVYKKNNVDLKNYTNEQLKDHFELFGQYENRIYCKRGCKYYTANHALEKIDYRLIEMFKPELTELEIKKLYENREKDIDTDLFFTLQDLMKSQCKLTEDNVFGKIAFVIDLNMILESPLKFKQIVSQIKTMISIGNVIDIYVGHTNDGFKYYKGYSLIKETIEEMIEKMTEFSSIDEDVNKCNWYLGFMLQRKYDVVFYNFQCKDKEVTAKKVMHIDNKSNVLQFKELI